MINMQTRCMEKYIQLNIAKFSATQIGPKNEIINFSILIETQENSL